jgi:hypothetical protein
MTYVSACPDNKGSGFAGEFGNHIKVLKHLRPHHINSEKENSNVEVNIDE